MPSTSARDAPTQVKWGATTSSVSRNMRSTHAWVRVRVEPSAPYVTDTKFGCRGARRCTASHSCCPMGSSLGGKNSKDTATGFDIVVTACKSLGYDPSSLFSYKG